MITRGDAEKIISILSELIIPLIFVILFTEFQVSINIGLMAALGINMFDDVEPILAAIYIPINLIWWGCCYSMIILRVRINNELVDPCIIAIFYAQFFGGAMSCILLLGWLFVAPVGSESGIIYLDRIWEYESTSIYILWFIQIVATNILVSFLIPNGSFKKTDRAKTVVYAKLVFSAAALLCFLICFLFMNWMNMEIGIINLLYDGLVSTALMILCAYNIALFLIHTNYFIGSNDKIKLLLRKIELPLWIISLIVITSLLAFDIYWGLNEYKLRESQSEYVLVARLCWLPAFLLILHMIRVKMPKMVISSEKNNSVA